MCRAHGEVGVSAATGPAARGGQEAGRRAGLAGRSQRRSAARGACLSHVPRGAALMLFLLAEKARGFKLLYVDKTLLWRNKAFSQRDIALYDGVLLKVGDTILR